MTVLCKLECVDVAVLYTASTGRSAVWGFGRSPAEIVSSNPEWISVFYCCLCCQVEVSATG